MRFLTIRVGVLMLFAVSVFVSATSPRLCQAAPLTFTATGVVDFVDTDLSGTFALGQTFVMTYTFESTTAARGGSNSQFAAFDALTAIGFTLGPYSASATGAEEIQVDNDPPSPFFDRYSAGPGAGSVLSGADVNGLSLAGFFIRLDDDTNTVFSDALILPTSLSLADFSSATFTVLFTDNDGGFFSASGPLTALVPEPASLVSIVAGLVGFAVVSLRLRRKAKLVS